MCNTCSLGQVKFVTPVISREVIRMCDPCPSCGSLVIRLDKFPSLISSWKIVSPTFQPWERIGNTVYDVLIIV
uniref:Uncharacterized protein n=1 Tax=viral metagenome TaxID=1070528 RepID=A0A6C0BSV2_9ZZZZ